MPSAIVQVFDYLENPIQCRILLDTGATANFTQNLVNRLNVPKKNCNTSISVMNSLSTNASQLVTITLKSIYSDFRKTIECFTVPSITHMTK